MGVKGSVRRSMGKRGRVQEGRVGIERKEGGGEE
jgi:hypothetical protein